MLSSISVQAALSAAEEIATEILAPNADRVDRQASWPEDGIRALQAAGLGGLVVPTPVGGLGLGLVALTQVCETLGRACPSTAVCFAMHSVGAAIIAARSTPEQKKMFLEPIVDGHHLTTLALSESGSGAHFYFPQTKLQSSADGKWEVNGSKSFAPNGIHADSYIVSTVSPSMDGLSSKWSLVLVPHDSQGLSWGAPWDGIGMRGNASRNLFLNQVTVPRNHLLGEVGDQIWYIFEVGLPYFLTALSGTCLGLADAALAEAKQHLKDRRYQHSGMTLKQIPILQHRFGTLWAKIERTRRFVYYAAAEAEHNKQTAKAMPAVMSAKADAADCVVEVVNEVMTLMGGYTYFSQTKFDRYLRDARAAHIISPTTDLLRTWVGRSLLDVPVLGE